jgi:hypothetical protein
MGVPRFADMSYPEDARTDNPVDHEVAEHVRKEDEEEEQQPRTGSKKNLGDEKKKKKANEEIEAEDDLREESPAPGYPDHTALPFPVGED